MRKVRKFTALVWNTDKVWYWQLNGSNGRVIALCPSGGYTSKRNAENAVRSVGRTLLSNTFSFFYPNEQTAAAA